MSIEVLVKRTAPDEVHVELAELGARGLPGSSGVDGQDGADGAPGIDGVDGLPGADGQDGADGAPGVKGDTGNTGAAGPQGVKGDTGNTGNTGAAGAQGVKGDTGAAGAAGAQGVKGDTGNTGAAGAAGAQGVKGDTGDTGAAGAPGTAGAQGVKGDTGAAGAPGNDGAPGAAGAQGVKGDTGNAGAVGPAGEGYTNKGTYNPALAYDKNDVVQLNGSTYVFTSPAAAGASGTPNPVVQRAGYDAQYYINTFPLEVCITPLSPHNGYFSTTAVGIGINVTTAGTVSLRFAAVAGKTAGDGYAALYDSAGALVVSNDDSAGSAQPLIVATLPVGKYFLSYSTFTNVSVDTYASLRLDAGGSAVISPYPTTAVAPPEATLWAAKGSTGVAGPAGASKDIGDAASKTTAQIDALFTSLPPDGTLATGLLGSTPTLFMRRGGKWHSSGAFAQIA